jgi:hypothetical protein
MRGVTFDEIDVRPLGAIAVAQGVMHGASDGSSVSDRTPMSGNRAIAAVERLSRT